MRIMGVGVLFLILLVSTSIGGCISQNKPETQTFVPTTVVTPTEILPTTVVTSTETTVEAFTPKLLEIPQESDQDENLIADSLEMAVIMDPQGTFSVIVMLKQPLSDDDIQIFESRGGTIEHTYDKAMYGLAGTITAEHILALKLDYADKLHFISEDVPTELRGDGETVSIK